MKAFFLKKHYAALNPDKIPWVNDGGKKHVYLMQYGLKDFRFLEMTASPNPGVNIGVGEADVNWAIAAYESILPEEALCCT